MSALLGKRVEGFLLAHSQIPAEKIKAHCDTTHRFGLDANVITLRIDTRSEDLVRLYASSLRAPHLSLLSFGWARTP